jgi:tetratricopeptide (TPR) repeat protein
MKKFWVTLVVLCVAITGGAVIYLNWQKTPPTPAPVAASLPTRTVEPLPSGKNITPESKAPQTAPAGTSETVSTPAVSQAAAKIKAASTPTALSRTVDALLSAHTSFGDKQALWKKIKDEGNLDQVLDELKQRAASNPNDSEIPATLGQAELQKAGVISQNGGSINEMGILGMQADQNFDAALKLDPANWEAQFFKAAAMSYWPLELNKGDEVVQRLSGLIDQQDKTAAQPEFAQAYVVLGTQYQKMGQPDKAQATWQLGAQKFPVDTTLRAKLTGQ